MIKTIGILIAIDIGTGLFNAIIQGKLSSKSSYIGMFKKVSILAVVFLSFIVGEYFNLTNIGEMVTTFFIVTESLSILENLNSVGVPIPPFLKQILLSKKGDDNTNEQDNTK